MDPQGGSSPILRASFAVQQHATEPELGGGRSGPRFWSASACPPDRAGPHPGPCLDGSRCSRCHKRRAPLEQDLPLVPGVCATLFGLWAVRLPPGQISVRRPTPPSPRRVASSPPAIAREVATATRPLSVGKPGPRFTTAWRAQRRRYAPTRPHAPAPPRPARRSLSPRPSPWGRPFQPSASRSPPRAWVCVSTARQ